METTLVFLMFGLVMLTGLGWLRVLFVNQLYAEAFSLFFSTQINMCAAVIDDATMNKVETAELTKKMDDLNMDVLIDEVLKPYMIVFFNPAVWSAQHVFKADFISTLLKWNNVIDEWDNNVIKHKCDGV